MRIQCFHQKRKMQCEVKTTEERQQQKSQYDRRKAPSGVILVNSLLYQCPLSGKSMVTSLIPWAPLFQGTRKYQATKHGSIFFEQWNQLKN